MNNEKYFKLNHPSAANCFGIECSKILGYCTPQRSAFIWCHNFEIFGCGKACTFEQWISISYSNMSSVNVEESFEMYFFILNKVHLLRESMCLRIEEFSVKKVSRLSDPCFEQSRHSYKPFHRRLDFHVKSSFVYK